MIAKVPLGHVWVTPGNRDEILAAVEQSMALGEKMRCIPINVTKYGISKNDKRLRAAINGAELVIVDGKPILGLARRCGVNGLRHVTGIELAESILSLSCQHRWNVFFLGANQTTLDEAVAKQRAQFSGLQVVGSRNGYFTDEDVPSIIEEVNRRQTDILLLGLGLPQKEYFIADHGRAVNASVILAVGGAFDVWAGTKKRAPRLIQVCGLEWLYRSLYDIKKATFLIRNSSAFFVDCLLGANRQSR